jgi:RNA-splicing ligase RtcB
MFSMDSKYEEVKIYAETIENEAISQITSIANSLLGEDAHIRIMPDAHAGKGCVIGTTMRFNGKVCPNIVGVDIGCGVLAYKIAQKDIDLEKLDKVCREVIVSGQAAREKIVEPELQEELLPRLFCWDKLRHKEYLYQSLGTLGGGNHFIELNKDQKGNYWLLIHSGSRNLGKQVAEWYQNLAVCCHQDRYTAQKFELIESLKMQGRYSEIETELSKLPRLPSTGLEYLECGNVKDYLHDMEICQYWASFNRALIAKDIFDAMDWTITEKIVSVHNYIDIENQIIRKGAISAQKGELCLIPLNMRDGTLICIGKGNEDWNYSAPHGAGRLMSRSKAKQEVSLEAFKDSMKDVYSSTVCEATIDESPFAYKDMEEIMRAVEPTVEIIERIVPIYNYKATT